MEQEKQQSSYQDWVKILRCGCTLSQMNFILKTVKPNKFFTLIKCKPTLNH